MDHKQIAKHIRIVLFWIVVWQLAAMLVHNPVLLVGPFETLRALVRLAQTGGFWRSAGHSFARIFSGLVTGCFLGITLASLGFRFPPVHTLCSPFVNALKSVPVACFVVMLLLWAGKEQTTVIVTAIVVFPILYFNTYQGLLTADKELIDIASMFTMTNADRVRHIYLPALFPYLYSAVRIACGMSWKSGVAAEVIALQRDTLGNSMNTARTLLETDQVFAVTLTVILFSVFTEKLLLCLLKRIGRRYDPV